jgi:hypothetical protein
MKDTIITSFPKRYGHNKPDPDSSVHKRIREKLKGCRPNEIRSAYDLALIIIDECSRVLLNSTKTADRQPKVMDLFANEIAYIVREMLKNQNTTNQIRIIDKVLHTVTFGIPPEKQQSYFYPNFQ